MEPSPPSDILYVSNSPNGAPNWTMKPSSFVLPKRSYREVPMFAEDTEATVLAARELQDEAVHGMHQPSGDLLKQFESNLSRCKVLLKQPPGAFQKSEMQHLQAELQSQLAHFDAFAATDEGMSQIDKIGALAEKFHLLGEKVKKWESGPANSSSTPVSAVSREPASDPSRSIEKFESNLSKCRVLMEKPPDAQHKKQVQELYEELRAQLDQLKKIGETNEGEEHIMKITMLDDELNHLGSDLKTWERDQSSINEGKGQSPQESPNSKGSAEQQLKGKGVASVSKGDNSSEQKGSAEQQMKGKSVPIVNDGENSGQQKGSAEQQMKGKGVAAVETVDSSSQQKGSAEQQMKGKGVSPVSNDENSSQQKGAAEQQMKGKGVSPGSKSSQKGIKGTSKGTPPGSLSKGKESQQEESMKDEKIEQALVEEQLPEKEAQSPEEIALKEKLRQLKEDGASAKAFQDVLEDAKNNNIAVESSTAQEFIALAHQRQMAHDQAVCALASKESGELKVAMESLEKAGGPIMTIEALKPEFKKLEDADDILTRLNSLLPAAVLNFQQARKTRAAEPPVEEALAPSAIGAPVGATESTALPTSNADTDAPLASSEVRASSESQPKAAEAESTPWSWAKSLIAELMGCGPEENNTKVNTTQSGDPSIYTQSEGSYRNLSRGAAATAGTATTANDKARRQELKAKVERSRLWIQEQERAHRNIQRAPNQQPGQFQASPPPSSHSSLGSGYGYNTGGRTGPAPSYHMGGMTQGPYGYSGRW